MVRALKAAHADNARDDGERARKQRMAKGAAGAGAAPAARPSGPPAPPAGGTQANVMLEMQLRMARRAEAAAQQEGVGGKAAPAPVPAATRATRPSFSAQLASDAASGALFQRRRVLHTSAL